FKAAVAAGGEITLTDNITLDAGIIIDKDVTINGNGNTITFTAGTALETPICNSADASPAVRTVESYAFNLVGGTVVFNNVTVSVPVYTAPAEGEEEVPAVKTGIFVFTGAADVTFNTVVTDQGYITVMFGAPGKLTVNEGTSLGASGYLNYALGSSKDAQNAETGVAPTVVITGGTISNETTVLSGDLARFDSSVNMTISGGTFVSRSDAIYISGAATTAASIKMTAGTVDAAASAFNMYGPVSLEITGGTVTKNIKYQGTATAKIENLTMESGALVTIGGTGNVTVKNLIMVSQTCFSISGSGAIVIDDCTMTGNGSGGAIYIASANAKNVTVKNSRIYSFRGLRFSAAVTGGTYTIENCTYRPQYTGTVDTISDYCTAGLLIGYSSDITSANCTFNVIGCNISNLEYGTGETLASVSKTGASYVFVDFASSGNAWKFDGCNINWNNSTYTFCAYKNVNLTLIDCTVTATSTLSASTGTGGMFQNNQAGVLTITGGTYTYTGNRPLLRVSDSNLTVNIDGATFINNGPSYLFMLNNGKLNIQNATLTQKGEAIAIMLVDATSGPLNLKDSSVEACEGYVAMDIWGTHDVIANNVVVEGTIQIAETRTTVVTLVDVVYDELIDTNGIAEITTTKVTYFEIGGVKYTWDEVVANLKTGDTVTIVGAVDWPLDLSTEVVFTIDFNGYVVPAPVFYAHTNVTFKNFNLTVASGHTLTIPAGATLTLGEGCVVTNTNFGVLAAAGTSATSAGGCAINNSGNLTINDGATINGTIYAGGVVVINGGTFRNGSYTHHRADKSLVFMNGTGDLTINGGDFEATFDAYQGDGEANSLICNNDGNANVTITGGTFTAHGGHAAYLYSNSSVIITGGTFTTDMTDKAPLYIGAMHGKRYDASRATELKNFTTNGGSCGVQFTILYEWHFTVENVTVNNAAKYVFMVDNAASASASTVTFKGGRYTLTGETADAAVLYVGANANVTLNGVMFINDNATSTAAILASGETANVTLTNVIVLANNGAAYKTDTETVNFGSASVKYGGDSYKLWMSNAGDTTDEALKLDNGASVRVDATAEMTGIRFTGSATKVEGAVYGIIIAPADYVAAAGAFTKEALDTWAAAKSIAVPYVMAEAQKSLHDNGDGTVSFSVALVDIQSGNYDRSFAAVPYVTVNDETTYGDYDSTNNARSMKSVATEALADLLTDAEHSELGNTDADKAAKYIRTITIAAGEVEGKEAGTYHSQYSADQRTALKAYIG
ncbi:MAG: hypothetical protein IJY16_04745, partial [Clostridia bacterium]|nr:hypothetical protein [Clostridia bacterium]